MMYFFVLNVCNDIYTFEHHPRSLTLSVDTLPWQCRWTLSHILVNSHIVTWFTNWYYGDALRWCRTMMYYNNKMKLLISCQAWDKWKHSIRHFTIVFDMALHHKIHRITNETLISFNESIIFYYLQWQWSIYCISYN